LTQFFRHHSVLGVDSASNRNEYQEYLLGGKGGRCLGLTTLPPSCAECLEICERVWTATAQLLVLLELSEPIWNWESEGCKSSVSW